MEENKPTLSRPYILTIDDDEEFNVLLKKRLEALGLFVQTTTSPKDFFHKVKTGDPSLCIVDLNLGAQLSGAGFAIIQTIRKVKGPKLPLIVLSRRASNRDVAAALELGANEYLVKPLDELLLAEKLRHFIKLPSLNELRACPLFDVSDRLGACTIKVQYHIKKIEEFGIHVEGDHYLLKGTTVKLKGKFLEEVTGQDELNLAVHSSIAFPQTGRFESYLEFDPYNDGILQHTRRWLMNQM